MAYDPIARGPHPVGVRTETWRDARSGLDFVVEIYYPATDQVAGHDLDEATQDSFENQWEPGKWLRQAAVRDATPSIPHRERSVPGAADHPFSRRVSRQ